MTLGTASKFELDNRLSVESKYESCLDERASWVIVQILNMMRNRTGSQCNDVGVALSEKNEETGKLPLRNNSGHIKV